MQLGYPIFQGNTDQDQLSEIYTIIGEPSQSNGNSPNGKNVHPEKKSKGKNWNYV